MDTSAANAARMARQLAAKDATIKYLRAELQRERERAEYVKENVVIDELDRDGFVVVEPQRAPHEASTIRDYLNEWTARRHAVQVDRAHVRRVDRLHQEHRARQQTDARRVDALTLQLNQERRARQQADARRLREVDAANARVSAANARASAALDREIRETRRTYASSHAYVGTIRDIYDGGLTRMREIYSEWQTQHDLRWERFHQTAQAARGGPVTPAPVQVTPDEVAFAVQESPALEEANRDLACVRVVGKAVPEVADLFPLISSFIISINTPIDLAVNQGSHHMTEWLLANGAQPTLRTAHVAVLTRSLPMVQMVFHHLNSKYHVDVPSNVFRDLPFADAEIAEWIWREYPAQMAHEAVRVATSHAEYLENPLTWYARRLKRHWKWEEEFARECYLRKRARAEIADS